MAKKRVMNVFARGERLIQNEVGFGDTTEEAISVSKKFPGDNWIESPDAPATRTKPDQYGNKTHFVEVLRSS